MTRNSRLLPGLGPAADLLSCRKKVGKEHRPAPSRAAHGSLRYSFRLGLLSGTSVCRPRSGLARKIAPSDFFRQCIPAQSEKASASCLAPSLRYGLLTQTPLRCSARRTGRKIKSTHCAQKNKTPSFPRRREPRDFESRKVTGSPPSRG